MRKNHINVFQTMEVDDIDEIKYFHRDFLCELKNKFGDECDFDEAAKEFQNLLVFNNFLKFVKRERQISNILTSSNIDKVNGAFFDFVIDFCGFNGFPQIVSDKEYEKIKNVSGHKISSNESSINEESSEYFRGQPKYDFHANLLCDFNYHHGRGIICNGIYATSKKSYALAYCSRDAKNFDENKIMKFKLASQNFVKDTTLDDYRSFIVDGANCHFANIKDNISAEIMKYFLNVLCKYDREHFEHQLVFDESIIAIIMGYDFVCVDQFDTDEPTIIVLNRGAITVSQSEFERICKNSKTYNDGTPDFSQKNDSNFRYEKY